MMAARTPSPSRATTDKLAAEVSHLAIKQSDLGTAVQAMQQDMHHMVKAVDKLVLVAERQSDLAGKIQQNSESLDRAFMEMKGNKGELAAAITKLSETLDRDRDAGSKIAETVTGYKAQLRLLYIVASVVIGLLVAMATMTTTGINARYVSNRELISKNANDIEVLEAKWERLRIGDLLIVSEHERRLSRIEARGDEVAP